MNVLGNKFVMKYTIHESNVNVYDTYDMKHIMVV